MKPLCVAAFLGLCLEALFSTGYRGTFLLTHSYLLAWVAAAIALLCGAAAYRFRDAFLNGLARLFPAQKTQSRGWFRAWLVIGLLLRIAWVMAFPTVPKSDGAAYYTSAIRMAQHTYTAAYWPPGLPLALAPLLRVFGVHTWVTILLCLFLFAGTYCAVWLLTCDLAGNSAAGIAASVVAVWPGFVTIGGTNSKEALIAFLLPTAMLLYCRSVLSQNMRWLLVAGSGALAGYCALTQPGCVLFFSVVFLIEVLRRSGLWSAMGRTAVFGIAMVLIILPWSLRNYRVVHRPVLITVNGGTAFYLANNPNANATYEDEGAQRLPDDLYEADRVGYREGKRWIAEHPAAFLALAVRKQIVFLGDDGTGVYETLKRDREPSRALYGGLKAVTSAFWLGFWVVMLAGIHRLCSIELWQWFGLCVLPILYQWSIDSIFISASHHHLSYVGFFAGLVALALASKKEASRL